MSPSTLASRPDCNVKRATVLILCQTLIVAPRMDAQYSPAGRDPASLVALATAWPEVISTNSWIYPVASLVLPGSGQLLAGQDRGVLYFAAEVLCVTRVLSLNGEAVRERDRYRDLAFGVARAAFSPARRDTVFEYFEVMEKYVESGPFDTDPGPSLVPPTDEQTYNGSIWKLARETFFADPDSPPDTASEEYQRALEFYSDRAVGPNFQWSWRNAGIEQDLYRQSIKRSDDAFRAAVQYLGLLLANHLLSAIDGFVSYRLSGNDRAVAVQSNVWIEPGWQGGVRGALAVRVGL